MTEQDPPSVTEQTQAAEAQAEAAGAEAAAGPAEAQAGAAAPAAQQERAAPPLPGKQPYVWGTGRRKKAVARVRIRPGTGKMLINKRDANAYFNHERDRQIILAPLQAARMMHTWDIWANVHGGGFHGQAGAVVLGLARALAKAMPELEGALRDQGLMTRDSRMKERKKYGQPGARRRFQFSKR